MLGNCFWREGLETAFGAERKGVDPYYGVIYTKGWFVHPAPTSNTPN
jgi:hypothetical protein|tara:strand:+ start:74 stop:214 length:141 start_codon:yes stop_codon:yes gene_type:complete